MSSFVDTNVPISYCFLLDPFNNKSNIIFKEYSKIFFSKRVKKEFIRKFKDKENYFRRIFIDFKDYLDNNDFFEFNENDLKKYVNQLDLDKNNLKSYKVALNRFWHYYINNKFSTRQDVISAIESFLANFSNWSRMHRDCLLNCIILTPQRKDNYEIIKQELKKLGVHYPDDEIILDAHDYNISNENILDFITFDNDCYNGAKNIKAFSFNNVKGLNDYL